MLKNKSIPILVFTHLTIVVIIFTLQALYNHLTYDLKGPLSTIIHQSDFLYQNKDFVRTISWYILQILLTYLLIRLLIRKDLKSIGFSRSNMKQSMYFIKIFLIWFPVIVLFIWLIIYLTLGLETLIGPYQGRTVAYAIKDLLVYGTLPGLSEEPFFRVFIIQFLLVYVYNNSDLHEINIKLKLIIISSVYFMLGHVFIHYSPFLLDYNIIQLFSAFSLGIFYSITYIKTKSILTAIVCHSYSDFIMYLFGYVLYFIVK